MTRTVSLSRSRSQLLDDLALEVGMLEPEDDQLDWSNGHA